ncbi:MAG TPA: ABC transporter substrate-binding protein [Xanthobacteraceae bacterium]|jgi:putative ABC transport system substrate-binding protein
MPFHELKRRELIALLGSAAVAWPLAAIAQETTVPRRLGILMGYADNDVEGLARLAAFKERLATLGWLESRNLQTEVRWSGGDIGRASIFARELVALQPGVILAHTTPSTAAVQRETRSIPVVFVPCSDPIGSGFVKSLAHPGGNITGFINLESTLIQKWLELLKEIAPQVTRAAVMFNPQTAPYADYYLRSLPAAAEKLGVSTFAAPVSNELEIANLVAALARDPGDGLVVMTDSGMFVHRKVIIEQTALHKVPAIYWVGNIAFEGGLLSYGVDHIPLFRRAATYVDRILRGAKPEDLPVQQPTKFELVINLKAAKALGLDVPPTLLTRADEVIE